MDALIGKVALALLVIYLAWSFCAAVRMYLVHNKYVHIEFAGKKWRSLGQWAPRQYRRLNVLRGVSIVLLLVWGAVSITGYGS